VPGTAFRYMLPLAMDTLIACQLGVFSGEERQRYDAMRAKIDAAVTRIVEIDDGYEFHLPGDDTMLALVAAWVTLERRCCPFFEFTVGIGASDTPIRVALTGGPEVKRFMEFEFRSRVVSPSALLRRGGS
jgi:hypothetical protein